MTAQMPVVDPTEGDQSPKSGEASEQSDTTHMRAGLVSKTFEPTKA